MTDQVDIQKLTKPFPREAVKQREGSRGKLLDYVEGHTVIRRLNEATGNRWNFSVLRIEERDRIVRMRDGEREVTEIKALVELDIPGLGKRQHVGVQLVGAGGGEDLYKGAITDALKKAATLFGVALELYGDDYEGKLAELEVPATPVSQVYVEQAPVPYDGELGPERASEPRPLGTRTATEKQVKAIYAIAQNTMGLNRAEVDAKAQDIYGHAPSELSRWEASQFIDLLKQDKVA